VAAGSAAEPGGPTDMMPPQDFEGEGMSGPQTEAPPAMREEDVKRQRHIDRDVYVYVYVCVNIFTCIYR